jgi:hypothetical protein
MLINLKQHPNNGLYLDSPLFGFLCFNIALKSNFFKKRIEKEMFALIVFIFLYMIALVSGYEIAIKLIKYFNMDELFNNIMSIALVFVAANMIAFLITLLLHFYYAWKNKSKYFLKIFSIIHFLVTYVSGTLSVIIACESMFNEVSIPHYLKKENGSRYMWFMIFFIALSNKDFYKTFQEDFDVFVHFTIRKIKPRIYLLKAFMKFVTKLIAIVIECALYNLFYRITQLLLFIIGSIINIIKLVLYKN